MDNSATATPATTTHTTTTTTTTYAQVKKTQHAVEVFTEIDYDHHYLSHLPGCNSSSMYPFLSSYE
jgi:hypothetical protein